mgnify:CR=1 FL=1
MKNRPQLADRRSFDKDLEFFARNLIGPDPANLHQRAIILIDHAAFVILQRLGALPAAANDALRRATLAATAQDFPRVVREIAHALACADRIKRK